MSNVIVDEREVNIKKGTYQVATFFGGDEDRLCVQLTSIVEDDNPVIGSGISYIQMTKEQTKKLIKELEGAIK